MTPERLTELDAAEQRFAQSRSPCEEGTERDRGDALAVDWMRANYGFDDVIMRPPRCRTSSRLAKKRAQTFVGQITWVARAELDEVYGRNDREYRAIREAIAAGSERGAHARPRARAALVGAARRDPGLRTGS